ncbi:MDR family MFS transporter [Hazenella coriacea]|uniref:DHA1 family multidrug resistance protein B-like MFS transporter n=1 Tax=Hazenella coriacea TaxID=1179467 RepID=A0A4R3L7Z3_9BACL|nr:MFS transporter [Hazenella coriacea]TCS93626.1 DHA1 family multidrug resistance protein B-like MFS transporter [Hazenella coriacea]
MFRELHPNIRIRIITSFLSRVVGSMIFPFMAIYFTKEINATWAGILLMIVVVVQFVSSLYGGFLADLLGRKKMMVWGGWMTVFAFIGMLVANSPWWTSAWTTFFMLVIMNISSGLVNPAAEAMLIDVSTKETRAFMYAINYWAVNLSIMLGLMVGGWFFQTHFFELLISLLLMSLFTLWMTIALIQETYTPKKSTNNERAYGLKPLFQSYRTVIRDSSFVWFTLGGVAILAIEFQRNHFISVRLEQEIIPKVFTLWGDLQFMVDGVKLLSLLTVGNTIIIVLFTALVAKWIRHRPEQPIMYIGFILFGLGYAFLAFSNDYVGLWVAVIVLSVGELLYVPTRQSILADIVDDSRRGAYMAFNGMVFGMGKMFGALGIIIGEWIGGIGMSLLYMLLVLVGITCSRLGILKKR